MSSLKTLLAGPLAPENVQDLPANLVFVLHQIYHTNALATDENSLHKFRVRISAFLKSNDSKQRWCGAFLALAAVQNSWECLKSHGATWLGLLIHILELPESPATWEMALRTSSEMFVLVSQKTELTRDVATSRIAPFCKAALAVLESPETSVSTAAVFISELQRVNVAHPVGFRPHSKRFQKALLALIATCQDSQVVKRACEALTVAHYSASQAGEAAEWRNGCLATVADIHTALNALVEGKCEDSNLVEQSASWGFEPKTGSSPLQIYNAAKSIEQLYALLTAFTTQPTAVPVKIPLGRIIQLFNRVLGLSQISFRAHVPQVEQSLIRSTFERVQIAAMRSLTATVATVGANISADVEDLLESVDMLPPDNSAVSTAALDLLSAVFQNVGYIASGSAVQEYVEKAVARALALVNPSTNVSVAGQSSLPDFITKPHLFETQTPEATQQTVFGFLETAMVVCELSGRARGLIDRTLLLSTQVRRNSALLTSALNPSMASKHSILAMVSQQHPRNAQIAQFVHPRLPPLTTERRHLPVSASLEQQEDLDDLEDEDMDVEPAKRDEFTIPVISSNAFASVTTPVESPATELINDAPPFEALPESVMAAKQAQHQTIDRPGAADTEFAEIEEEEALEDPDSDEEMGSDFEMPALDVGDSDDDE